MLNKILKALKENNIELYLINEETKSVAEMFFIKKNLDMRRLTDVTKYEVTVYTDFLKDGNKMRGFAVCNINPGMTDEEVSKKLSDTLHAASFACNPYFELPKPSSAKPNIDPPASFSPEEGLKIMSEALFAEDNEKECFINSAEMFVKTFHYHTISSEGIDVSYNKQCIDGEFVIQCTIQEDVETYQDFYYDTIDSDALRKKVKHSIELTKSRSNASRCNLNGNMKVILSGQYASDLLKFYLDRAAASMIYPKYSDFELNKQVQAENITGDALNIALNSDVPYSKEGIPMTERTLLENGILKCIHGPSRFCYYLNTEPTGIYDSINVNTGSKSLKEMENGTYLHIVNFSDFQMDNMSGRFGGEFRLAFYSDGKNVIPITGGSISGSILELGGSLKLSSDPQTLKGYKGPLAIEIPNVTIG